jgi:biotin carboxyl carrier protein
MLCQYARMFRPGASRAEGRFTPPIESDDDAANFKTPGFKMKKTLRISFNGKTYEVVAELLDESGGPAPVAQTAPVAAVRASAAPAAPATPAQPKPSASSEAVGDGVVTSPLAGKVVSIAAVKGASVTAGSAVVTLEAMKMNTIVSAPHDGVVADIHVAPGDTVEEGQPLITLQ